MGVQDFKKLAVWRKAHALSLEIYRTTGSFPRAEQFGMTSQLRRAAISVVANVAEACGRRTPPDQAYRLDVAAGSLCEVEALLLVAADLGYIAPERLADLIVRLSEVRRMLAGLIAAVRANG